MKTKNGISLIVLVITIIVIIILATAVILTISKNNPIDAAKEAVFKSNIDSFQNELSMYNDDNYVKLLGEYEPDELQADSTKVEYTGAGQLETQGKTIKDVITGLNSSTYNNEFEVLNGKLAYKGTDKQRQDWASSTGIILDNDKTNVTISTKYILPIKQTGSIEYTIDIFSNVGIKDIGDITNSIKVIDKDNNLVTATIKLGEIKNLTNEKQITVTVQGTGIADGNYKVKLLAGAVENNANLKNADIISINSFAVDGTAPVPPSIVPNIPILTNQNVVVTITYPKDSVKNEYSYDGNIWSNYTDILTIMNNCTIYARATDAAGNTNSYTTLSIINIDKENPKVSFSSNGANNVKKAETLVNVTDNSNEFKSLQYEWTTSTIEPVYGWITFENNSKLSKDTVTGSYYLWIKVQDAAGNIITTCSNAFEIDNTAPTVTANTDQNVGINTVYTQALAKSDIIINDNLTSQDSIVISSIVVKNSNNQQITTTLNKYDIYSITCTAQDLAGNIITFVRKVTTMPTQQISLTNIVTNGSFESGNSSWRLATPYASISTTYKKFGNNSLHVLNPAQYNSTQYDLNVLANNKYYVGAWTYILSNNAMYMHFLGNTTNWWVNNPKTTNWVKYSNIVIPTNSESLTFHIADYGGTDCNCEGYYDGVFTIDLTTAFGSGNEPTLAWCNSIIPFFEANYNINNI